MKVIFSDIDGVYNTPAVRKADDRGSKLAVEIDKIMAVKNTALKHGAVLVISSSWRFSHPDEARALGFPLHDDWRTISRLDGNRGLEVQEWLSRHPEVKRFAILDDHNDFLPEQQAELVWTCTDQALTDEDVMKLEGLLA
jgi:hypothetical protein